MNFKKYIIPALLLAIISSGCKKEFYTDVNVNTNAPDAVPPASLLSTVEGSLAYTQGGDMSRFTSLITQQTLGASRQAEAYYQYVFTSQDVDNLWANLYTTTMENCKNLIDNSEAKHFNGYAGVGRMLMAYTLQISVDCWGNIPYSQAFQGLNNIQPSYDDDQALYTVISDMVDEGLAELNADDPGALTPGGEDVIYGGDLAAWQMFGHAIKARLAIHQSKNNAAMAQTALDEIALSFADNSTNAVYIFGSTETSANPWYQFNEQRADISFASAPLADMLVASGDPRYPILIDSVGEADGFGLAPYYGGVNGIVEFITYDELQFIKAEATIRVSNNVADAQTAYLDAINSNMSKLGVDAADPATIQYITDNGTLNVAGGDSAIAQIANQAYIALYLNPEAWVTYRRTGYPALTPVSGSAVPRRLLYPQTEYTYNGANTPPSTLFSPLIFWDVQ